MRTTTSRDFEWDLDQRSLKELAALIVAAPELLEALEALLNYDNLGSYDRANARQLARAAIAKATRST